MMIKRGVLEVHEGGVGLEEMMKFVDGLKEGEYDYILMNKAKNRSLPQLKYLFGTVLKTISREHPDNPPIAALYRFFEDEFAPLHTCTIDGQSYTYLDLKNEKSGVVDEVIDKVIAFAESEWGIKVPTREEMKAAEARQLYGEAYLETWKVFEPFMQQTSTHKDTKQ